MYLLKVFSIVVLCLFLAQCHTDKATATPWDNLKKELHDSIKNAKSDFEKTSIIRSRLAELIDVPNGSINDIDVLFPDNRTFDLNRFVGIFEKDSAGAICGTSAYVLRKVYEAFGYKCKELDVGDRETGLSHVTCLVSINHSGKTMDVIQDVTYNFAVVNRDGNPIDYAEMVRLLNNKNVSEVAMTNELKYCDALIDSIPPLSETAMIECLPLVKQERLASGKVKYRIPKTLDFILLRCGKRADLYLDMISRNGFSRHFINLFLINPVVS